MRPVENAGLAAVVGSVPLADFGEEPLRAPSGGPGVAGAGGPGPPPGRSTARPRHGQVIPAAVRHGLPRRRPGPRDAPGAAGRLRRPRWRGWRAGPSGASRRTSTPRLPARPGREGPAGGDSPGTAYLLRRRSPAARQGDRASAGDRAGRRRSTPPSPRWPRRRAAASAAGPPAGRVRGLDGAEQLLSGAGRPDREFAAAGDRRWGSGTAAVDLELSGPWPPYSFTAPTTEEAG